MPYPVTLSRWERQALIALCDNAAATIYQHGQGLGEPPEAVPEFLTSPFVTLATKLREASYQMDLSRFTWEIAGPPFEPEVQRGLDRLFDLAFSRTMHQESNSIPGDWTVILEVSGRTRPVHVVGAMVKNIYTGPGVAK